MTEDETVGWHHRLGGHEFEQAPGAGEGQGSLACCSPWGRKESDTTEQLNKNSMYKALCKISERGVEWDFPGGPVVKTLHFHCRGHKLNPWWGN